MQLAELDRELRLKVRRAAPGRAGGSDLSAVRGRAFIPGFLSLADYGRVRRGEGGGGARLSSLSLLAQAPPPSPPPTYLHPLSPSPSPSSLPLNITTSFPPALSIPPLCVAPLSGRGAGAGLRAEEGHAPRRLR